MIDFGNSYSVLEINLKNLEENYKVLQKQANAHVNISGVIKANAYGLGTEAVATTLQKLNCPQFFVANLDEALSVREYDKQTPIAVFGGLAAKTEGEYLENDILPVLNSLEDIRNWQNFARLKNVQLPSILHFDTGMNRLGLSKNDILLLKNKETLKNLDVQLVMTHFACADEKDHPLTAQQAADFKEIAQLYPNAKKSLSNSSGLFRNTDYHYDMARPGYALYGGNPTPETTNPMHNVVSLYSKILQIRDCKKDQSIGYGANHKFNQDTRTATIGLGYADGFTRNNGGVAKVYYNNIACPVIGRVSMDLITVDISHINHKDIHQGAVIEILGPNQSVDDFAAYTNTIGYEVLTSLGARYKRHYISN